MYGRQIRPDKNIEKVKTEKAATVHLLRFFISIIRYWSKKSHLPGLILD
jgi:hypothetical protein